MSRFLAFVAALFLSSSAAFAQGADAQTEEWKANAGLNALINTGNSSNVTVGGNALTSYRLLKNKIEWSGAVNYGRAKDTGTGVTTTNTKNWFTQLRYDRYLSNPVSLFALGRIGADVPAGFNRRYGTAAGLAHELYRTDPHFFKYEVGFDWTREERTDATKDNLYSGRLFLQYILKISEFASFNQDIENLFNVESGKDYRLNSLTGVTAKLTNKIALKAGYAVRFDNVPVAGKKKVDTSTQVGIVVDFL